MPPVPPPPLRAGLIRPGTIDVPQFLAALGVRNISPVGSEVSFSCPFPGHAHGDERPSARMNSQTTAWYCHGCKRSGNAVTFSADLQGVTNHVAWDWIVTSYGEGRVDISPDDFVDELDEILGSHAKQEGAREEEIDVVSPSGFSPFWAWPVEPVAYMSRRGFAAHVIVEHGLMWDRNLKRIVTPIRDELGKLVGWKGRKIDDGSGPKYLVYKPVYPAAKYVYLLYSFVPCDETIIVVEGEWNALMMRQYGFRNAVGLPGSHMSHRQAALIANAARTAILVFDSDEAGYRGTIESCELLEPYMNVKVVPDHKMDPASMDLPEIAWLLDEARTRLDWELE